MPKKDEKWGGESSTIRDFIVCTFNLIVRMIKCKILRWAGHAALVNEKGRNAFKILTRKPTGRRPLGKPRRIWEDNIRMDIEEIGINAGIGLIRLRIGIIGEPL